MGGGGSGVFHQRGLIPPNPIFSIRVSVCLSFLRLTIPVRFPDSNCIGQGTLVSVIYVQPGTAQVLQGLEC